MCGVTEWIIVTRARTYTSQQSFIICATIGSTSSGISRRLSWNPTAPTTCIGFIPLHGMRKVANSHSITPKLYTSHLQANQIDWKFMTENSKIDSPSTKVSSIIYTNFTHFSFDGSFLRTSGAIHSGCSSTAKLYYYWYNQWSHILIKEHTVPLILLGWNDEMKSLQKQEHRIVLMF